MAAGLALLALLGAGQVDAKAVLDQVQKTYDAMSSYADTGTATQRLGSYKAVKTFKTLFVRDQGFRFEYTTEPTAREERDWMVVWLEGERGHRFWSLTGGTDLGDLGSILDDLNSQAAGSAIPIPRLLLGEQVPMMSLAKIADPVIVGNEKVGAFDCYHVNGAYGAVGMNVWIDCSSSLVRRIQIFDSAEGASNDDVDIVYKPVANPTIEKSRLVCRRTNR